MEDESATLNRTQPQPISASATLGYSQQNLIKPLQPKSLSAAANHSPPLSRSRESKGRRTLAYSIK